MHIVMILFACVPNQESQQSHSTHTKQETSFKIDAEIDVTALHSRVTSKSIIIDVRTPQEYAQGHLPNAKNIPIQELRIRMKELIPYKDKEIFLVCASGVRSHNATQTLQQKGFSKAINVIGGTRGWQAKGFPTEK